MSNSSPNQQASATAVLWFMTPLPLVSRCDEALFVRRLVERILVGALGLTEDLRATIAGTRGADPSVR